MPAQNPAERLVKKVRRRMVLPDRVAPVYVDRTADRFPRPKHPVKHLHLVNGERPVLDDRIHNLQYGIRAVEKARIADLSALFGIENGLFEDDFALHALLEGVQAFSFVHDR